MTNFNAGDPSGGKGGETTNFKAEGGAEPTEGTQDTTVVLEVGGRKFTKTDLIKKITNADGHIERLEGKLDEQNKLLEQALPILKQQVNAAEILNKVREGQQAQSSQQASTEAGDTQGLTLEAVLKELDARDAKKASVAAQDANWKEVTQTLTKAFGDATNQKVTKACEEAGITLAQAEALAKNSPKVFLRLFPDLKPVAQPSAMPQSGKVNTFAVKAPEVKTTGFFKAASTKESVSIYLNRLKELGLGA